MFSSFFYMKNKKIIINPLFSNPILTGRAEAAMLQHLPPELTPPSIYDTHLGHTPFSPERFADIVVNDTEGNGGMYMLPGGAYRDLLRMGREYCRMLHSWFSRKTVQSGVYFDKMQGLSMEELQAISSMSFDGLQLFEVAPEGRRAMTRETVSVTIFHKKISIHTTQGRLQVVDPFDVKQVTDVVHDPANRKLTIVIADGFTHRGLVNYEMECYDQAVLRSLYYVIISRHEDVSTIIDPVANAQTVLGTCQLPQHIPPSRVSPSRSFYNTPHTEPEVTSHRTTRTASSTVTRASNNASQSIKSASTVAPTPTPQHTPLPVPEPSVEAVPVAESVALSGDDVYSNTGSACGAPGLSEASIDSAGGLNVTRGASSAASGNGLELLEKLKILESQVEELKVSAKEKQSASTASQSRHSSSRRSSCRSDRSHRVPSLHEKHSSQSLSSHRSHRTAQPISRSSSTLLASDDEHPILQAASVIQLIPTTPQVSINDQSQKRGSAEDHPQARSTIPQVKLKEQVKQLACEQQSDVTSTVTSCSASDSQSAITSAAKSLVIVVEYTATHFELDNTGLSSDVSRFLVDQGFLAEQCLLADHIDESQPTKKNILTGIRWLMRGARSGEALFISISARTKEKELYPMDYMGTGPLLQEEISHLLASTLPKGCKLLLLCDIDTGELIQLPYQVRLGPMGINETRPDVLRVPPKEGVILQLHATSVTSSLKKNTRSRAGVFTTAVLQVLRCNSRPSIGSLLTSLSEILGNDLQPCVSSNFPLSSISEFTLANDVA
eukprot:TRINITY_DN14564_c2_g1_i1.p1 TRINITY_DN14564_c2_g1~~TRINITY_DN14564_c2_g1_i1.p1  ORF type:complete len:782 (+),score=109.33 TRINITY_DN14564_c2_g1_i1:1090-3435(+)